MFSDYGSYNSKYWGYCDRIDAPNAVSTTNLTQLGTVVSLTEADISIVLTNNNFKANSAATFTLGTGSGTRTFLALNDGTAGFLAVNDAIIEITGYSGNLSNLAIVSCC